MAVTKRQWLTLRAMAASERLHNNGVFVEDDADRASLLQAGYITSLRWDGERMRMRTTAAGRAYLARRAAPIRKVQRDDHGVLRKALPLSFTVETDYEMPMIHGELTLPSGVKLNFLPTAVCAEGPEHEKERTRVESKIYRARIERGLKELIRLYGGVID